MASIQTGALVAALTAILAGCATSVRPSDGSGTATLSPMVAQTLESIPAPDAYQHSEFVLVSDEGSDPYDYLGAPPATLGGEAITTGYPAAPPLPNQMMGALDESGAEPEAAADEETPLESTGPAEEMAQEQQPNTIIDGPGPVEESAPRLVRSPDACCPPIDPCLCGDACREGYVGAFVAILPGLGAGIDGGVVFKRTDCIVWSLEGSMSYQDYTDFLSDDKSSGKMVMANLGVRALFKPNARWHPFLTAGMGWFHATGTPTSVSTAQIDFAGDYLGGYLGAGLEYDLNGRWSIGAEARIFLGGNVEALPPTGQSPNTRTEGTDHFTYVPMIFLQLHYNL